MIRQISGLRALVGDCEALLLDQWGVLHDGHRAYPGAIDCLRRLREAGMEVIILSNSGKSGDENARLIERMGFTRDLFDSVASAGDDARDALLNPVQDDEPRPGPRCLLLARDSDRHLADGLGLEVLTDPQHGVDRADFLLLMSMDAPHQSVAGWEPLLRRAVARGLPMICGNPDLARVSNDGTLLEAPGLVAQRYLEFGGKVRLHGKPHLRIYRACLQRLSCGKDRVMAIGDSLHHDIAGARAAGVRGLLIAGGVHLPAFGCRFGELPDPLEAQQVFDREGVRPDLIAPAFIW